MVSFNNHLSRQLSEVSVNASILIALNSCNYDSSSCLDLFKKKCSPIFSATTVFQSSFINEVSKEDKYMKLIQL